MEVKGVEVAGVERREIDLFKKGIGPGQPEGSLP